MIKLTFVLTKERRLPYVKIMELVSYMETRVHVIVETLDISGTGVRKGQ